MRESEWACDRAALALREWRLVNGIRLFSDCIVEIGAAYADLDRHRIQVPDIDNVSIVADISAAAITVERALRKCDGLNR